MPKAEKKTTKAPQDHPPKVEQYEAEPLRMTSKQARAFAAGLELTKLQFEIRDAERADEIAELKHNTERNHEGYLGVFRLYSDIKPAVVESLRVTTARYCAAYPKAPIELVISSPGGSVFDGWVLFDHLRSLSAKGHKVTTTVRGCAASMAAVLAQAGDVRVIGPESYLIIHEASTMSYGTASEMEDTVDFIKILTRQSEDVLARRAKINSAEIRRRTKKTDWVVNAKEAKKLGFVDVIQ